MSTRAAETDQIKSPPARPRPPSRHVTRRSRSRSRRADHRRQRAEPVMRPDPKGGRANQPGHAHCRSSGKLRGPTPIPIPTDRPCVTYATGASEGAIVVTAWMPFGSTAALWPSPSTNQPFGSTYTTRTPVSSNNACRDGSSLPETPSASERVKPGHGPMTPDFEHYDGHHSRSDKHQSAGRDGEHDHPPANSRVLGRVGEQDNTSYRASTIQPPPEVPSPAANVAARASWKPSHPIHSRRRRPRLLPPRRSLHPSRSAARCRSAPTTKLLPRQLAQQ